MVSPRAVGRPVGRGRNKQCYPFPRTDLLPVSPTGHGGYHGLVSICEEKATISPKDTEVHAGGIAKNVNDHAGENRSRSPCERPVQHGRDEQSTLNRPTGCVVDRR